PFGAPYPLVAAYSGDATNLGSKSGVLTQEVLQTNTVATITSSVSPSSEGHAVTFTATITSPTVTATGPVTFSAGSTVLGTAQLTGGKAKFTPSTLPAGSTRVKATYYSDSNIAGSSASLVQTVQWRIETKGTLNCRVPLSNTRSQISRPVSGAAFLSCRA